ncbi:MAG: DUF3775 domain-containing protein [Woeseiaceae bacterium]|nr:DUF3775 domain-containing protein [Woeseiaceae bacterium]
MELDISRDIVAGIIDKVLEFSEREDVTPLEDETEPDINDEAFSGHMADRYGTDPYYQHLKAAIEDLEPDQQVSIVTLMWIGRGDYSPDEWDEAYEHAQDSWNDHTADYLIGTPLLADYLNEGLDQLEDEEV